ncbi:RHS repeat-associated core domain-containing protein [Pseudomonas sp. 148P]|uniref:RHS repeat-associated core domain-containing protein n=1 Tax=Pseudomonas ulcerans TaxID=3115852 RepID=A0ABU7HZU5_9PSED|nr:MULTISPECIES: RHS repeat-associated core domain-containing protein [unclassified Pseudomonas]MEE1921811.1 RHS repeat-associated core domain-containing protein [Pseudomonas sp. 147P]MEE1937088.1 RHS repeat-associated core domain-containing protein [Pseudomonas sp. 148P]
MPSSSLGFNGQLREPPQDWYHLGHGRRVYSPLLMRFHCPDDLSPFGAGGLNAYAYCQGDPLNFTDPTGRSGEGLHEMTYVLHALVQIVGVATLLMPHWLARGAPGGRRARFVDMKPDMATPIGGLNAYATGAGMLGSVIGIAATAVSAKDPQSEALSGLMYAAMTVSLGVLLVKGAAFAAPKNVPSGQPRKWAEFLHGKRAVRDATMTPPRVPESFRMGPATRQLDRAPSLQMQEIRSPKSHALRPPSPRPGTSRQILPPPKIRVTTPEIWL